MKTLVGLLLSTLAVLVAAYLIQGVTVDGFFAALVVAIVLAIVNAIVKPIIKLLTLPITFLTLGLFSLVISAAMVLLTDLIVPGFTVNGFIPALLFGIVLSLINSVVFAVTKK